MADCKVRSGKPGRFERKKGTKGAAFRRRAGVNREQTGTWDAKKGPFTVRLRSGGCGERKKEEPWGDGKRFCAGAGAGTGTPYRFWVRRQKEDVRTREGRKRELLEKSGRYRKGIEISQA